MCFCLSAHSQSFWVGKGSDSVKTNFNTILNADVRIPAQATNNANIVAGFDSKGNIVPRTMPAGTDSAIFATVYDVDTAKINLRNEITNNIPDSTIFATIYRLDTVEANLKALIAAGSADSSVFATIYMLDTVKANLTALIAVKVNYTDTANMLSGYTRQLAFIDSMAAHWAAIQSKGTVTNISGGTHNGFAVSVANPNTTPAIAVSASTSLAGSAIRVVNVAGVGVLDMAGSTEIINSLGYTPLASETDPIFTASAAFGITSTDKTHWTQAYDKYLVSGSYSAGTLTFTTRDGNTWAVTGLNTGTVTSITAGTGLSGGAITTSGTISMPNTGTAGTYGGAGVMPVITTDAQGRITSVTTVNPFTFTPVFTLSVSGTPSSTVTGTTSETFVTQVAVPAGLIGANGNVEFNVFYKKVGTAGIATFNIRLDTVSGGLTGSLICQGATGVGANLTFRYVGMQIWNANSTSSQVSEPSQVTGGVSIAAATTTF